MNSHQIILIDNKYKKSKISLHKEFEDKKKDNETIMYPAPYYNEGDILLNYFLVDSSLLEELKFTSNYNITYIENTWSNLELSWNEYVYRESKDNKINISTNYSI